MADTGTILLAGASRGLGLGLARAYLEQGWTVIATARDPASPGLTALGGAHPGRLRVEKLDITSPDDMRALASALAGTPLDIIFVVAGMHIEQETPIADVPPEAAALEFMTNAIGPVALGDRLAGLAATGATRGGATGRGGGGVRAAAVGVTRGAAGCGLGVACGAGVARARGDGRSSRPGGNSDSCAASTPVSPAPSASPIATSPIRERRDVMPRPPGQGRPGPGFPPSAPAECRP